MVARHRAEHGETGLREKALRHAFGAVARDGVRDLVTAHRRDPPADRLNTFVQLRVPGNLALREDLLIGLKAKGGILRLGKQDELASSRHRRGLAAGKQADHARDENAVEKACP